jgi:hypothetical protein
MMATFRKPEIMISTALMTLWIVVLLVGRQTMEERLRAGVADDAQCRSYGIKPGQPE